MVCYNKDVDIPHITIYYIIASKTQYCVITLFLKHPCVRTPSLSHKHTHNTEYCPLIRASQKGTRKGLTNKNGSLWNRHVLKMCE